MEYESVKKRLSGVTKDKHCKYNKFKDEDHYTIRKNATIHGTAAALQKFKKLFPHYRLTGSTVRAMREKYHQIVKSPTSSSLIKKISLLKRGRPLLLGSLDKKVQMFFLSDNPKHFSNTTELLKLLDKIIIPYVKNKCKRFKLEPAQPALLILDVFSGQMTTPVTDKLAQNCIKYMKVPANMANLFQPLD